MKVIAMTLLALMSYAQAALIDKQAPEFMLKNELGKQISLKDFKGKYVVLEWMNHGCPFVKKHYNSNNMQETQAAVIDKNTVWLSIISSAEGKQGYSSPEKAIADKKRVGSLASHILLDTKGTVGQSYGAKTTPHMFIIDPKGIVQYEGAIDSVASADPADIADARNYIKDAFSAIKKGEKIKKRKSRPYGCSVKY